MGLQIPTSVNYATPLVALPSFSQDQPTEGRRQIPLEITWSLYNQVQIYCVAVNVGGNGAVQMSQISALKIDNSRCDSLLTIYFPDTSETITIPSRAPMEVVPIYSNALTFYIAAPDFNLTGAPADAVTRMQVLNYLVSPAAIGISDNIGQVYSGFLLFNSGVGGPTPHDTTLINSKVLNGILDCVWMNVMPDAFNPSPAYPFQSAFNLLDGGGVMPTLSWVHEATAAVPTVNCMVLVDMHDLNVRFSQGLKLRWTPAVGYTANTFINTNFWLKWRTTS